MSRVDWKPLAERLRRSKIVVLGTHINADGDGLGCEIALHQFLAAGGWRAHVVNSEPVPARYRFLRGSGAVEAYDGARHAGLIRDADLFVVLDNSSVERLEKVRGDVEASRACKVCIDHHVAVNPYWDLNCVDTDASASGQLVYELIRFMGGSITQAIAEALYVSLVTDTGHFRFTKTTAETHRIVADLLDAGGVSPPRVYTEVYERNSRGLMSVMGHALASLRLDYGGRLAWMRLTWEQVRACRAEEEDTGDLANLCLQIDGVLAGALFREMPDGRTKVSLRSKGEIDVNSLAVAFGGGGHRNASGILTMLPLDAAAEAVLRRAREIMPAPERAAAAPGGGRS